MSPEAPFDDAGEGSAEPGVLAFANDPASEYALREGLAGYRDAQVWSGGVRSAVAALRGRARSLLLFVDLDEAVYPAGAIHELAAVCELGTAVVAFGSDGSARFSRKVLLAGVNDYLVKPLSAAAARGAGSAQRGPARALRLGARSEPTLLGARLPPRRGAGRRARTASGDDGGHGAGPGPGNRGAGDTLGTLGGVRPPLRLLSLLGPARGGGAGLGRGAAARIASGGGGRARR